MEIFVFNFRVIQSSFYKDYIDNKPFEKGKLYLNEEPPDTVKNMENPYDTLLRDYLCNESGESYYVDYAYYNGKYYVYFGALPVLLLFLPYYIITGTHLSILGVISVIGIFFVVSIYAFTYIVFKNGISIRHTSIFYFFIAYFLLSQDFFILLGGLSFTLFQTCYLLH